MNRLDHKAAHLWDKFSRKQESKFWPYYDDLLNDAKQTQQVKVQVFDTSPRQSPKQPRSYSPTPPPVVKKKMNPFPVIFAGLILLFFLVNILEDFDSISSIHSDNTEVKLPYQTSFDQYHSTQRKENWLKAQLNSAQQQNYHAFIQNTELSKEEAITRFITQNNLIDWSQKPVNVEYSQMDIYMLFTAGEKSILYGELEGVKYRVNFQGKYYLRDPGDAEHLNPLKKIYQANLELIFHNNKVVHKKDGYYIIDSVTKKVEKVVKGGEQLFKIKLVIKELKD